MHRRGWRYLLAGILSMSIFLMAACNFDLRELLGSSEITPTPTPSATEKAPTEAPAASPTGTGTGTSTFSPADNTVTVTSTPPANTPDATQTLQAAFNAIDEQFTNALHGNIAFNKPEQMKKGTTVSVELVLSPSLSEADLATRVTGHGGLVTSTADANVLISPGGGVVTVQTGQIEITPRMRAVLTSPNPEAFTVKDLHDNPEQLVSSVQPTTWRWAVTANKAGPQTLELVIYQLVKYDGREYWPAVETYRAEIVVQVSVGDRLKALDWKWIATVIILPLLGAAWGWWRSRKKTGQKRSSRR